MSLQDSLNWALARLGVLNARYRWRDTMANIGMGWGNFAVGLLMAGVILAGLNLAYGFRVWDMRANSPWSWVAIFFLDDFIYYGYHRLSHEHRIWWAAHVNHHSSEHYNFSTAVRQTWTGVLVGTWLPWLLLALLGFAPWMILVQQTLSLFYQFWIHTESVRRLPAWIEAVFNTLSHHRVHHASNPRCLDRNYGGVLIIWDRLFGSFVAESSEEPIHYGLMKNVQTFNPLRIAMHEWWAILVDLRTARSWHEAAGTCSDPRAGAPMARGKPPGAFARWRERIALKT